MTCEIPLIKKLIKSFVIISCLSYSYSSAKNETHQNNIETKQEIRPCESITIDQPLEEMEWKDIIWQIEVSDDDLCVISNRKINNTRSPSDDLKLKDLKKKVLFRNCIFTSTLDFSETQLKSLRFQRCKLESINGKKSKIEYGLEFDDCVIGNIIYLDYAIIGHLAINNSTVGRVNDDPKVQSSISSKFLQVSGSAELLRSCFRRELYFHQSKLDGGIKIENAFVNGEITFDESVIGKSFNIQNTEIRNGTIRTPLSIISGNLDLNGVKITNSLGGDSIYAYGMKTTGTVHLTDGFACDGAILISDCKIGAAIEMNGSTRPKKLDLTSTECQRLQFSGAFLPKEIFCSGFLFKELAFWDADLEKANDHTAYASKPFNISMCKDFCEKAMSTDGHYAIFRKFATVFENHGDSLNATEFRILAEKWKFEEGAKTSRHMQGWFYVGKFIGYGYKPLWVIVYAFVWWVLASIVFYLKRDDWICPKDGINRKDFNSFVYSLDTFLPFVDLRHAENYMLKNMWHSNCFFVVHVFVGWFLATLLVAGISGWAIMSS